MAAKKADMAANKTGMTARRNAEGKATIYGGSDARYSSHEGRAISQRTLAGGRIPGWTLGTATSSVPSSSLGRLR
jgi:hypothetical protein